MKKLFFCLVISLLATGVSAQWAKASKADSTAIRKVILSFYDWYKVNHRKLNSFELYRGVKKPDEPPYKIDWKEAERYFAYIRSSVPQLGEEFIKDRRAFLKLCEIEFKKDPEGDIPYGFDFDWYTNSQEDPEWLVDEIKKAEAWLTIVNGMDAEVEILADADEEADDIPPLMCYGLKKEKGKWKISWIGCKKPGKDPPPMEEIKQ